jgi:hypothetical protein
MAHRREPGPIERYSGDYYPSGPAEPSRLVTHPEEADLAWDRTVNSMREDAAMPADQRARIAANVEAFLAQYATGTLVAPPEE